MNYADAILCIYVFDLDAGCPALFGIKLGLILGTKIRIFRANLGLKFGIV